MKLFSILFVALLAAGCGAPPPDVEPAISGGSSGGAAFVSPTAATPVGSHTPAAATPTALPTATAAATSTSTTAPTATLTATPSGTPVLPSPTPTASPASTLPVAPIGVVLQGANLRGGPGSNYPLVGQIGAGQEVFLRARNAAGDWIELDMAGADQVWIAAFLLDLPAGLDLPLAAAIPPTPTPVTGDTVRLGESRIQLPTYPWQAYTTPVLDETTHWEFPRFDRAAYEAAAPGPTAQSYRLVTLENQWLQLTLLPEVGGRIYQMIFKPTGSNQLYENPVLKPSPWGSGPNGNGWLAAGGIEWDFPTTEHGYAWAESWGYITAPRPPAASVTLFDRGQNRLHLNVEVGLRPDSAAFTLNFYLENRGDTAAPVNYWTNAMLAPGPANRVGPDLRFFFPAPQMMVHSTGDADLPGERGLLAWPVYNGRDLSRLGVWNRWLGFFAYPQAQADWAAVYDTAADEGVVRIFPRQQAPGLKGFGFGWTDPIAPSNYTDDGSSYVEMHGGLTPTFWDALTLAPAANRSWSETWYPAAGIGGVTAADRNGAIYLTRSGEGYRLRIFSVFSRAGELSVSGPGGVLLRAQVETSPAHPLDLALPASALPLSFRLRTASGPAWAMNDLQPATHP